MQDLSNILKYFAFCNIAIFLISFSGNLISAQHAGNPVFTVDKSYSERALVIGVQNDIPQRELDLLKSSVEHILSAFGDVSITVQLFSRQQLKTASENHSLDLIFSDPAVLQHLKNVLACSLLHQYFRKRAHPPNLFLPRH